MNTLDMQLHRKKKYIYNIQKLLVGRSNQKIKDDIKKICAG
jgi:hypothetical protein